MENVYEFESRKKVVRAQKKMGFWFSEKVQSFLRGNEQTDKKKETGPRNRMIRITQEDKGKKKKILELPFWFELIEM